MARRTWEQYEKYILQEWPLTRREVQVAVECIKGQKNKEIAALLGIGAETVNKTLDHIYRATGVNSRDQLVAKLLIADIENTPLQQSLVLAGAGAALVGVGFIGTLYSARSERKRPRSLRRAALPSKRAALRSKPVEPSGVASSIQNVKLGAAVTDSTKSIHLEATEESPAGRITDLSWMTSTDAAMERTATEN